MKGPDLYQVHVRSGQGTVADKVNEGPTSR
jgi:hypothetical protein